MVHQWRLMPSSQQRGHRMYDVAMGVELEMVNKEV